MRPSGLPRWARLCAATLGAFAAGDCGRTCLRAQSPPEPGPPRPCCRDHLHVYMVNGLTILPHNRGGMNGVGVRVEELGFHKPRVASHYGRWSFRKEIRRVHCDDPQARFVLVGYSLGGSVVCGMARQLEADGIFIDLLVYIDAHSFVRDLGCHPSNVGKVLSINSSARILAGKCHPGEECYRVDTPWHLSLPRKEQTLGILAEALREVGGAAPPAR